MKARGQRIYSHSDRLMRMVEPNGECWDWTGSKRGGYGRLVIGSRSDGTRKFVAAHRLSYETFVGPITDGLYVCHRCDNRRCINPSHLFLGTHQQNIDDRESKGRNNHVQGMASGTSKLTDEKVILFRQLHRQGQSIYSIAKAHNFHKKTVSSACKGKSWKHVPAAPTQERGADDE